MPPPDEHALVERARDDPRAFAALYDRYVEAIFRYALRRTGDRALAEDVTSATFEKALRHLRRYGWKGSSYRAWLYRLASQQVIQRHRRDRRYVPLPPDQPAQENVEQAAQSNLQWQALERAYRRLSRDDRQVLALRLFDRLPGAEVAEILGCSPQNVYVRLYRALQRLRHQLSELGELTGGDHEEG